MIPLGEICGNEPTERNKQRQNSCGWGAADEDDGDDADGDDADDGDDGEDDDDHAVADDLYSERDKDDKPDQMASPGKTTKARQGPYTAAAARARPVKQ